MKKLYTLLLLTLSVSAGSQAQTISTIAGSSSTPGYGGDSSLATAALLNIPSDIALDNNGDLYIADMGNGRVRKVAAATGIITTVAGNGTGTYSGDGGQATAAGCYGLFCIALDGSHNLYIGEIGRIRKVAAGTGIITTIAGTGTYGTSGDGVPATTAQITTATTMQADAAGNIYFGESDRLRKIDTAGIITTIAGGNPATSNNCGDGGPATAASINGLRGLTLDGAGNIFVTDFYHNIVRKIDATGIITAIAGIDSLNSTAGFGGDGGAATMARLSGPNSVAIDGHGNTFIGDVENYRIRMIDPSGTISTILGNGIPAFSGDGGPAVNAQVVSYTVIRVDAANNIYFVDPSANRVRKITPMPTGIKNIAEVSAPLIYPNPSNGRFTISLPGNSGNATITVSDVTGRMVLSTAVVGSTPIDLSSAPSGVYLVKTNISGRCVVQKMIIQ